MTPRLLTLEEVADYFHCHVSTVGRLVRRRKIPAFKVGRNWRLDTVALDAWVRKGERRGRSGQIAFVLLLAMPAILGAFIMTLDYAVLTVKQTALQSACDLAVEAGAGYLLTDAAAARDAAQGYIAKNAPGASATIATNGDLISVVAVESVTAIGRATVAARCTAQALPAGIHRAALVQ